MKWETKFLDADAIVAIVPIPGEISPADELLEMQQEEPIKVPRRYIYDRVSEKTWVQDPFPMFQRPHEYGE